jgi:hypothetical protein
MRAEGYCMSAGEAEMARRQYLRKQLLPVVAQYFTTYERLQSAMLCVAQYWCDEANDAVHGLLIVSELFEPTLEGVESSPADLGTPWDDNSGAIPLWAAFATEGGTQEYGHPSEVYASAVMFYRHGGYEILPMRRSQLDGVQPESD